MKILEITLLSDDLLGTENFYSDVLGLRIVSKDKESITFMAGISKLTFLRSAHIKPTYHFAFNIPNNKLEEAIRWCNSKFKLIPIQENQVVADFKNWNAKSIYFYDNNLNVLEFIARFDLDNSIESDFKIKDIQSISEIGLIAEEPEVLSEELIQHYGLSYFTKGAQGQTFKTLGNDEGLIIIVQSNHNWYPTKMAVKKHFMEIKLSHNSRVEHIKIMN